MTTAVLPFQPLSPNYQVTSPDNNIFTKLDGGQSRGRRDILNGTYLVEVNWILNRTDFTIFQGFVEERIQDASKQFLAPLLTRAHVVVNHICRFTAAGKPKLTSQSGDAYFMSGIVEVTPNPTRSFTLFLQNTGTPQFVDSGSADYSGDLSDFTVGRSVLLTGTTDTVTGIVINLDGTYTINTAPNNFTRTLLNAATINPGWTTLLGTVPKQYAPTGGKGAAILLPV